MSNGGASSTLNVNLTQHTFWFSGSVQGVAMGSISQCRLFDTFQVTPPTSFDDPATKVGVHIVNCEWARRGDFWLQTALSFAASYSTSGGASGSVDLGTKIYWQPVKLITVGFGITLDGTADQAGFHGQVRWHDAAFKIQAPVAGLAGIGLYF